jgi:hypothetical protein
MPFKTLSAPRKIHDLQADVRSTAFLANPGIVAKLSTDPVRLATIPTSGSGIKVTNISLDSGQEVGLLSRDIAVVRAGDDSVWALIDITHTPKMDQVARDVRTLCMRPSGESALAIGWDGTATHLTLARHEVDARQFALRGTIRACDLTETETFVVVDGADGGQLRVHPGATPEPGASLRCNLPMEAAKLDRVRGGARLSVVYKPGLSTICVITGGPNRLAAKMVQLEGKPTDMGVVETSLVVTFADGRAVLYDSDAIAAAGDAGPMEPKHHTPLGARGEPRTVLLTTKGGATLWVGTSSGEVVSLSVVRKAASV